MLYCILCTPFTGKCHRVTIGLAGGRPCGVISSMDWWLGSWRQVGLWLSYQPKRYILGGPSSVKAQTRWHGLLNPMMNCALSFPSWMEERTHEPDRTRPRWLCRCSLFSIFIDQTKVATEVACHSRVDEA